MSHQNNPNNQNQAMQYYCLNLNLSLCWKFLNTLRAELYSCKTQLKLCQKINMWAKTHKRTLPIPPESYLICHCNQSSHGHQHSKGCCHSQRLHWCEDFGCKEDFMWESKSPGGGVLIDYFVSINAVHLRFSKTIQLCISLLTIWLPKNEWWELTLHFIPWFKPWNVNFPSLSRFCFCQTPLQLESPNSTSVGRSRIWLCFHVSQEEEQAQQMFKLRGGVIIKKRENFGVFPK